MIRSMTGFGRGQVAGEDFEVRTEVRSVNNRNLRITFRLPERLQGLETELEKRARNFVSRGTITVAISLDELKSDPAYEVNRDAIRYYRDSFAAVREDLQLSGEVPLAVLVTLPGVIQRKRDVEEIPEGMWKGVLASLDSALAALIRVREEEGALIWKDIVSHCKTVSELVNAIEAAIPQMIEAYSQRLSKRLKKLLERIETSLTEEEFRREVALFADRSDISEEITRLRSHIQLMTGMGSANESCGKRLEFIAQEMFREANTMASKANDPGMVQLALDIKTGIEKIREQVMNIE